MSDALHFDTGQPRSGGVEAVAPGIRRLVAPNPGPFTQSGTCSYLIGERSLAVIDPGPDDAAHLSALLAAIGTSKVEAILVTHTHRDHSPLAPALAARTGAPILSAGPHRLARSPLETETAFLDASADLEHRPDRVLADGERLDLAGEAIDVIATPGHAMNHLCFALPERKLLFSGDHVMGWSTSIVAPPDGAMAPYLASLRKTIETSDGMDLFLPGHGNPVKKPIAFTRALLAHRLQREASILARIRSGDTSIAAIVEAAYRGLDPRLVPAARLSVFAHVEALIEAGQVIAEGPVSIGSVFRAA